MLLISILSVSISSIMIKSSDTPTSVAGMYRLYMSVLIMLPFVPWKMFRSLEMNKKDWSTVFIAGLFLGLYFLFWMESLVYTSVASSMVILSLQPLFVMMGSYFMFRERANILTILCLIAALVGSIVIAWGDIGISREALIGDGLSLVGTILVSAYMLAGQKVSHKINANLYSVIVFFIGGSVMLVYNLLNHYSLIEYDSSDWMYFLLLAVIPTIFGQYIFNLLLKSMGATTVSVGIIGEPVLAIILAYLFLGEIISAFQFIGGIMTLFGMGMYFWAKSLKYTTVAKY
nr:DMT family transporter [Paenibacillus sp. A3M_27_13]